MYLSKADIKNTSKIKRLNIINAVSGIKPGNLIGTKSHGKQSNLAIFSSIVAYINLDGHLVCKI